MSRPVFKHPIHLDRLLQVADTYGTPSYVYFEEVIREQIGSLRKNLQGIPFNLLFAMKANSNPALLRIMVDEGLGIDAVSPAELLLALQVGYSPDKILYSANNMTDEEMHFAHSKGVLLNIGEPSRLEKFGQAHPGSEVCVRLNPQVGAGHHEYVITAGERSKFGIPVAELAEIHRIVSTYNLRLLGLHQHIGSGILNTEILWQAIKVILDAALAFPELAFINLGGGFGVPYKPGEKPLDLQNFKSIIVDPLRGYLTEHPSPSLRFWFEPGRYLVAEAGTLLVQVNTIKKANGRTFVGVDSGMGHLIRPAIYGAYHGVYNLSNPDGPLASYDVVGNICESSDIFAKERPIQEIREGDLLAVQDTGAYGMAMAMLYNLRALPSEILVPADATAPLNLLRERLTPEALVEQILMYEQVSEKA